MTTAPKGTGYIGRDPAEGMSIALRVEMRGDACACCGARVLVHAAGFREAQQMHRAIGKDLVILCPRCGDAATEIVGGKTLPTPLPPGWKKHLATDTQNN